MLTESSLKPYLIRAFRDWAMDNGFTPQVLIDVEHDDVDVPGSYVSDGRIVLNIHDNAISNLDVSNEWIQFSTRFSGVAHEIAAPLDAILAIYTRENSEGMVFQRVEQIPDSDDDPTLDQDTTPSPKSPGKTKKGQPHLRIVR